MKKQFSARSLAIVILLVLFAIQVGAREKIDLQMVQRIRKEGLENSKITDLLIYLCDVYGPRLPASPQYMPLIAYPKAWTPGTKGVLKGNAVLLDVRNAADLDVAMVIPRRPP